MASTAMSQLPSSQRGSCKHYGIKAEDYLGRIKDDILFHQTRPRETRNREVTGSEIQGFNKSIQEE